MSPSFATKTQDPIDPQLLTRILIAKEHLCLLIAKNRATEEQRTLFASKILRDRKFYEHVLGQRDLFKLAPDEERRLHRAIARCFGGKTDPRNRGAVGPAGASQSRGDQSNSPRSHIPRDVASQTDQPGRGGSGRGTPAAQLPARPARTPLPADDELAIDLIVTGRGSEDQNQSFVARLLYDDFLYQKLSHMKTMFDMEAKYSATAGSKAARLQATLVCCDTLRKTSNRGSAQMQRAAHVGKGESTGGGVVGAGPSSAPAGRNPPGKGAPSSKGR